MLSQPETTRRQNAGRLPIQEGKSRESDRTGRRNINDTTEQRRDTCEHQSSLERSKRALIFLVTGELLSAFLLACQRKYFHYFALHRQGLLIAEAASCGGWLRWLLPVAESAFCLLPAHSSTV